MRWRYIVAAVGVAAGVAIGGCTSAPWAHFSGADGHHPYESQQAAIKALNDTGRQPVASYALAKAQCWLDVSFHEYTRNDRSAFPRQAFDQSNLITEELKASGDSQSARATPLVNGATRLRPDLWERLQALERAPGASCGAALIACAEVELVHAGNEFRQIGWRHARPYIQIAEDRTAAADRAVGACAPPAPPPAPAVAPPVAPAPLPSPRAEQTEHVSLGAEALFRFDGRSGADLLPEGRAKLDELAAHLHEAYSSIRVIALTGHTDRLGGRDYNARLALDRANTVRAYLVSRGVQAPIETRGMGAAQPLVSCAKKPGREALRACLQPNRRVEIDVSGVRRHGD